MATGYAVGDVVSFQEPIGRAIVGKISHVLPHEQYMVVVANRPHATGPLNGEDLTQYSPRVNDYVRYNNIAAIVVRTEGPAITISSREIGLLLVDISELQFGYVIAALRMDLPIPDTNRVTAIGEVYTPQQANVSQTLPENGTRAVQSWQMIAPIGAVCSYTRPGVAVLLYMWCRAPATWGPSRTNIQLISQMQNGVFQHEQGCAFAFTCIAGGLAAIDNDWEQKTICPVCGAGSETDDNWLCISCGMPRCAFYSE